MAKKPDIESIVRSAKSSARFLQILLLMLWGGGIAAILVAIDSPSTLEGLLIAKTDHEGSELSGLQLAVLMALKLSQLVLWGLAVNATRMSFAQIACDQASKAASSAARAAKYLWVGLAWSVIAKMPFSVIATWHYPLGQRILAIEFDWLHLAMLFVALIIGFYSRLIRLGAELWQDHKEIV